MRVDDVTKSTSGRPCRAVQHALHDHLRRDGILCVQDVATAQGLVLGLQPAGWRLGRARRRRRRHLPLGAYTRPLFSSIEAPSV